MSRSLALRDVDHVVLERGRIGERWHSERWRSLNLLTTNAMSALPGLPYDGSDPDAFMPAGAFAAYLKLYALTMDSPIMSGVEVTEVEPDRRRIPRLDHRRRVALARRRRRDGRLRDAVPSGDGAGARNLDSPAVSDGLLGAGAASGWRRAGGRRLVDRRSARRGDPCLWAPGDARRRGSHARAPPLSRTGHLRLDGDGRHSRRSGPRGGQS